MELLKFLIHIGLIFVVTAAVFVDVNAENKRHARNNYRLPDDVIPLHYDVKLIPYMNEEQSIFKGEIQVTIKILRKTRNICLHMLDLTLEENMTKVISPNRIVLPKAHDYNGVTQIMTLDLYDELDSGFYLLVMTYYGTLNDDLLGFFRKSYNDTEGQQVWLVATQFAPTWARRAFPCWDEPALKATFNISIKHDNKYEAFSNMPIVERYPDSDEPDKIWTHFNKTPVMSTYLVAFAVVDYVGTQKKNFTSNMWYRSQMTPYINLIGEFTEKCESLMTQYTKMSHYVPKLDHIAIPKSQLAMENWGLITYDETFFGYDENSKNAKYKQTVAVTVAHEISHQWFGNLVSPSWWSYLWLKESFASFFEYYLTDQIFTNWRMMELFVVYIQQAVFRTDIGRNIRPLTFEVNSPTEIQAQYTFIGYYKGAVLLRMLQHIMTKDLFRESLIKYLDKQ